MRRIWHTLVVLVCFALVFGAAFSAGCGTGGGAQLETMAADSSGTQAVSQGSVVGTSATTRYFLAVHNEPQNKPGGRAEIEQSYQVLREMVARADSYNIKLTLMFTAQWADYISESPERAAEVRSWAAAGHEISAHHHGVWHGSWDGYSSYPEDEAEAIRIQQGHNPPEQYHGTLNDYIGRLRNINPKIKSGCLNEEPDKKEMPGEILYGTGSGYANHGTPGTREGDNVPEKGINDFITVGNVSGIQRRWLAHSQIYHDVTAAERTFSSMKGGIYGGVVHSVPDQADDLYAFMEFLHSKDPEGAGSVTLSGGIEGGFLPEQTLADDVINATNIRTGPAKPRKRPPG